jgi:hypothetical protein
VSELGGLDWGQANPNKVPVQSSSNQTNIPSFTSDFSSSNPIDRIPTNLDEDSIKEKVDEVIKVILL